jgi:hypothetical protein
MVAIVCVRETSLRLGATRRGRGLRETLYDKNCKIKLGMVLSWTLGAILDSKVRSGAPNYRGAERQATTRACQCTALYSCQY